ncbi:prepilin peptidase-dependent protein [Providencia huaxiensis]|uniref:prepilin peptidase-dependent protein n=1 Tax=Providencia TaxID=586 RepID=UPI00234B0A4F|nr:prepilin peptidase-dependent protein [Providencia sp. PROV076]
MLNSLNHDKFKKQRGFTLIEMLMAMAISSIVCVSAMSVIPTLFKQTYRAYIQYQIDKDIRQTLINMEKDFRRIGYCGSLDCGKEPLKITSKFLSRGNNSCIIFAYDQDLSGKWEDIKSKSIESDYFGYRLNNEKLESNRNVRDCDGTRWQSLFDEKLIKVTTLAFGWQENTQLLEMKINLKTDLLPNQTFNYQIAVLVRNL